MADLEYTALCRQVDTSGWVIGGDFLTCEFTETTHMPPFTHVILASIEPEPDCVGNLWCNVRLPDSDDHDEVYNMLICEVIPLNREVKD